MKYLAFKTIITLILLIPVPVVAQPALEPGQLDDLQKRLYQSVKPTDEQGVQLDQIFRTHRQALENWRRRNGETLRDARRLQADALKVGDRDTLRAVQKELRELMESRKALLGTLKNRMEDVLDEQQFAKARALLAPPHTGPEVLRILPQLKLTNIQNEEVKNILDQAALRARTKNNRAAREEILDAAVELIRRTVLSQVQRDTLDKLLRRAKDQARRREMLRKMDFTDEQKARIKTILDEANQRAEQADTPPQKRAILAKAHRMIRRDVWTQQQRDQFFLSLIERRHRGMRSIGMTEAQIARAEKILADARDRARSAVRDEEKRQILRDAFETIRRTVLHPDQRERLK